MTSPTARAAWLAKNAKGIKIIGGTDTAAPPTFAATAAERETIRRFLNFALNDLRFSGVTMLGDKDINLAERRQVQADIAYLSNYVKKLREGVDVMIETPKESNAAGTA